MNISVIIPIYNAEKFLPVLFEALDKCNFREEDEILLVDNGSSDRSLDMCKSKEKEKPERYKTILFYEKAGSYAARNYGVTQASGQIFLFTDSDTRPVAGWIDAIRENIAPGIILAGKIQLEVMENGLWEHFDTIAHLNSEKNAVNSRIATANMAVTKEDFFKVGLFEERFSGGDYDWSQRAVKIGLKIKYVSDAMVYHPTRKTYEAILKKERRIAFGAGNHHRIQGKSFIMLLLIYIMKIFKFDTNLRYAKQLQSAGLDKKKIFVFQKKFMAIRIEQLKYAVKGYKMLDARHEDID